MKKLMLALILISSNLLNIQLNAMHKKPEQPEIIEMSHNLVKSIEEYWKKFSEFNKGLEKSHKENDAKEEEIDSCIKQTFSVINKEFTKKFIETTIDRREKKIKRENEKLKKMKILLNNLELKKRRGWKEYLANTSKKVLSAQKNLFLKAYNYAFKTNIKNGQLIESPHEDIKDNQVNETEQQN